MFPFESLIFRSLLSRSSIALQSSPFPIPMIMMLKGNFPHYTIRSMTSCKSLMTPSVKIRRIMWLSFSCTIALLISEKERKESDLRTVNGEDIFDILTWFLRVGRDLDWVLNHLRGNSDELCFDLKIMACWLLLQNQSMVQVYQYRSQEQCCILHGELPHTDSFYVKYGSEGSCLHFVSHCWL